MAKNVISHWLGRLRPKTAEVSERIFFRWLDWIKENGGLLAELGPDGLVSFQLEHKDYQILDKVQEFVRSVDGRTSYKKRLYSTLKSFFVHNRAALPIDPGFKIYGDKPPVNGTLRIEDLKRILDSVNPMYRALYLCMFQAGMGMQEFQYWNRTGLKSLREQLAKGQHLIRIDLPGRKHNYNLKPYYTFIGLDAIKEVKHWLKIRPDIGEDAIFLSREKTPPAARTIRDYWQRHLKKLGLIDPMKNVSLRTRYGKNLHELRDTFRSRWRPSGADVEVAEFFMGHDIDRLGYDKSPWQYSEWFEEQYLLAEPWLNILSEDPEKVPARDFNRLRTELEETKRVIQEAEWLLSDPEVAALLKQLLEERKQADT